MDTIPLPLPDGQTVTDHYQAAIGQRNQDYYLTKFEDFDEHGEGMNLSWNWAAFLFTGVWALYRRMYGWFFIWWAVATILVVFENSQNAQIHQTLAVVVGALWLGFGALANTLYHHKVRSRIAAAQKSSTDAARVSKRLRVSGGVLAWVPIAFGGLPVVGILVAVALPKFQDHQKQPLPPVVHNEIPTPLTAREAPTPQFVPFTGVLDTPADADAARERGDYATALRMYVSLASKGDARSQVNLGAMYDAGEGVERNYIEAVKWYRMAAENGLSVAQFLLGVMYENGHGVAQDFVQTAAWYRLAAMQGHPMAQRSLGKALLRGRGVPQSHAEAARWLRLASAQGDSDAQTVLATMYAFGEGLPVDLVRAHMWSNLGAMSGSKLATEVRETIAKSMTAHQIARSQQMASECQRQKFNGCD